MNATTSTGLIRRNNAIREVARLEHQLVWRGWLSQEEQRRLVHLRKIVKNSK